MKPEHTPGPWELDFASDLSDAVVYKLDCGTIAVIPGDLTANAANARLVKAAPEMAKTLMLADELLATLDDVTMTGLRLLIDQTLRVGGVR